MTTDELDRALRQLRLGGMADTMNVRAQQARADSLGPLDFLGLLVHDELNRRRDRLVERTSSLRNSFSRLPPVKERKRSRPTAKSHC
jgi:hypothetical protein